MCIIYTHIADTSGKLFVITGKVPRFDSLSLCEREMHNQILSIAAISSTSYVAAEVHGHTLKHSEFHCFHSVLSYE